MKMISFDCVRLIARLFVLALNSMLFTCMDRVSITTLPTGTIRYESSANLTRWFPEVTSLRSPALITYEAGPMPDPACMMLAVMEFSIDVCS